MNNLFKHIEILQGIQTSDTLTELANKLYLSQPYISRIIKQLENKYKLKLVNRETRPISLTNAGETILSNLKQLQITSEKVNASIANLQRQETGNIKIALCSLADSMTIPQIAQKLHQLFPQNIISLSNEDEQISESRLANKSVDIIVGRKWNNPTFNILPLQLTELALLIPDSCPLYDPTNFYIPFSQDRLSTLNGSTYVAANDNSYLQHQVNNLLAENNIFINKIFETSSSQLATQIAISLKATTITTTKIAKTVLQDNDSYCLMRFPKEVINLNMAITYLNDASAQVKAVAHSLQKLLTSQS